MRLKYLKNVVSLRLDPAACVGCGRCVEVCPRGVFVLEGGKSRIVDLDGCLECGACGRNCSGNAISVKNGVGCAIGILNTSLGRAGACCGEQGACSGE